MVYSEMEEEDQEEGIPSLGEGGDELRRCGTLTCALLAIWSGVALCFSITRIHSTEVGIAYDTILRRFPSDDPLPEGMHLIPPFGEVYRWPRTFISSNFDPRRPLECNSKDGIRIRCLINFQYSIWTDQALSLTVRFHDVDAHGKVAESVARSAMLDSCGDFTAREFQTRRMEIPQVMAQKVQKAFDAHHLASQVIEVQLVDADRPPLYEAAVADKEAADADIERAENERVQQLTTANTRLLEAERSASIVLNEAERDVAATLAYARSAAMSTRAELDQKTSALVDVKRTLQLSAAGVLDYLKNELLGLATAGHLYLNLENKPTNGDQGAGRP